MKPTFFLPSLLLLLPLPASSTPAPEPNPVAAPAPQSTPSNLADCYTESDNIPCYLCPCTGCPITKYLHNFDTVRPNCWVGGQKLNNGNEFWERVPSSGGLGLDCWIHESYLEPFCWLKIPQCGE
ncbi:hypothetical protein EX30DRAFT_342797 [Ascodesmis nigricans]|uniref:Uncharacterized protein n=1 Tax=Ascodesmis nigricans TaxID=341454 RepID=A0A4S2MSI4_9PEZI|nr:hypothetical protein EX30DRAFT_342797 [Ascodesmis nigricans]